MIPHFDPPLSAEMIRDGGSLAMSFDSSGQEFWLFFPLLTDHTGMRTGYDSPIVINRTLDTQATITWEDAASWLRHGLEQMEEDHHKKWASIMLEVALTRGLLPQEISPIIGGKTNPSPSPTP